MDDRRLNLSALDPARDPDRWQSVFDATLARVDDVLAQRGEDPLTLIAAWRRPLLAAAAAAVLMLVPIEILLENREDRVESVAGLVAASNAWAQGAAPTGADLLRAMDVGTLP